MSTRALDGLSTEELRETRRGFGDDAFTEVLLRRIPEGTTTIVDIGCGLANTAHALLPDLITVALSSEYFQVKYVLHFVSAFYATGEIERCS